MMYILYYILTLAVAFGLGHVIGKRLYARRRYAAKQCSAHHSAVESAHQIGKFLSQRRGAFRDGPHLKGLSDGMKKELFYKGVHFALIHFIRVCHLYGCEVEIRQVTRERTKPEVTDDELITFMRPSFYEKQEYVV